MRGHTNYKMWAVKMTKDHLDVYKMSYLETSDLITFIILSFILWA